MSSFLKKPLRYYIRENPWPFVGGLSFLAVTNVLDALYPLLIKKAIDQIEISSPQSELNRTVLLFFGLMVGLSLARYGWRFFWGLFHTAIGENLRQRLYNHLSHLGPSFYHKNSVGELMSLATSDVNNYRMSIGSGLLILVDGIMILLVVLPIMLYLETSWAWKCLLLLPITPFLIWWITGAIHRGFKKQQDLYSEVSGHIQETILGIRTIKGYAREKHRLQEFVNKQKQFTEACSKVALLDSFFVPAMELGVVLGSAILLVVTYPDLMSGRSSIGTFVAFNTYLMKLSWPMTALGLGLSHWQKGQASLARIRKLFEESVDITTGGKVLLTEFRSLKVENLSFRYSPNGNNILDHVSFELKRGERLGIVGSIGSGKTSLAQLLVRLYPVTEGKIFINDLPIDEYDLGSLRKVIQLVPQDHFLFSETVLENLSFGLSIAAGEEKLNQVTEKVQIRSEIFQMPERYNTLLGEKGVNLSGGQKQRLSLGRGLILEPGLLILDDVLSAVDVNTEKKISDVLYSNPMATIMISHRLEPLMKVDRILVLKDGKVEAIGTFGELFQKSATFRNLAEIQELSL